MKSKLLFVLLIIPFFSLAQSVSASRILAYANSQNVKNITTELKQKGFSLKVRSQGGYTLHDFSKQGELLSLSRNDELFMVVYKPSYSAFSVLRTKLLTPDFQYAYNYKNNDYYENSVMRIGVNDINGIISIFKPLK